MENMGRKRLYIIIITVVGISLGVYLYYNNRGEISDTNIISSEKLADTDSKDVNDIEKTNNATIETSSVSMKISPNAIIIQKRYYKTCDHLIREIVDIPVDLVNKTEQDVKEKYSNWKLEGYSPTEIVLYKEFKGICDEHYVVKEHNGVIGIYTENEQGVQELQEDTDIVTQYLPDEDLDSLKIGVKVVGKTNLISFLEDYE